MRLLCFLSVIPSLLLENRDEEIILSCYHVTSLVSPPLIVPLLQQAKWELMHLLRYCLYVSLESLKTPKGKAVYKALFLMVDKSIK